MNEKVFLILVDGVRPDALLSCGGQWIIDYFRGGTYSFQGRTVFPPVTLPVHISLLYGVEPQKHGVLTNEFFPDDRRVNGLIEVLARHGKRSAFFYCWEQLRDICTAGNHLSYSWFMSWEAYKTMNVDRRATEACKEHIAEFEPDFVFLYHGEADEIGHQYGWMSPEYLDQVRKSCDSIRDILTSVPEDYSIIITSDHGGHGFDHGENIPEDMMIPICFRGKRFAKEERNGLSILDIPPTITHLLGIEADPSWEGKNVCK